MKARMGPAGTHQTDATQVASRVSRSRECPGMVVLAAAMCASRPKQPAHSSTHRLLHYIPVSTCRCRQHSSPVLNPEGAVSPERDRVSQLVARATAGVRGCVLACGWASGVRWVPLRSGIVIAVGFGFNCQTIAVRPTETQTLWHHRPSLATAGYGQLRYGAQQCFGMPHPFRTSPCVPQRQTRTPCLRLLYLLYLLHSCVWLATPAL